MDRPSTALLLNEAFPGKLGFQALRKKRFSFQLHWLTNLHTEHVFMQGFYTGVPSDRRLQIGIAIHPPITLHINNMVTDDSRSVQSGPSVHAASHSSINMLY